MNNKRVLYFFTSSYPYGTGETFIENEIEILCKNFDKILIFPNHIKKQIRPIPNNAEVVKIPESVSGISVSDKLKFNVGLAVFSFKELIENPVSSDSFRYRMAYFKQLYARYLNLKNLLKTKEIESNLFYTFWFEDWATVLGLLKRKKTIHSFVSRAHGYDIYEERRNDGVIPFRKLQLNMVDRVYCASKASMNYMKTKYPEYSNKITYSYLGVKNNGRNHIEKCSHLTIVSCSNIIPLKQVGLIPEILKHLKQKVKWVHFGDGVDMRIIREKIKSLPNNISTELKGRVSNEFVLEFYKDVHVDLFFHFSLSEGGVPVSIQEAASFGIPIIAFDSGGVSEIVDKDIGLLLSRDLSSEDIVSQIQCNLEKIRNEKFRLNVKKKCEAKFSATRNYLTFSHSLYKHINE